MGLGTRLAKLERKPTLREDAAMKSQRVALAGLTDAELDALDAGKGAAYEAAATRYFALLTAELQERGLTWD